MLVKRGFEIPGRKKKGPGRRTKPLTIGEYETVQMARGEQMLSNEIASEYRFNLGEVNAAYSCPTYTRYLSSR